MKRLIFVILALSLTAMAGEVKTTTVALTSSSGTQTIVTSGIPFDFGNGADGAAHLDGINTFSWAVLSGSTYALLRPVYFTDLTIDSGIILKGPFSIYVNGTLANDGRISNDGVDAVASAGGANAGIANASQLVAADFYAGGNGATAYDGSVGELTNGDDGSCGTLFFAPLGAVGGCGGAGGNGFAGTGGAGGLPFGWDFTHYYSLKKLSNYLYARSPNGFGGIGGGESGGAGASGAGDGINAGGASGGGGGAGGVTVVFADTLNNTGVITAYGGAGGDGASAAAGNAGGGGGGGGGAGGYVFVVNRLTVAPGGIFAAGGTQGAKGLGHGTGTDGTNGTDGSSGVVLRFETSSASWQ